jgi:hypothetical protein
MKSKQAEKFIKKHTGTRRIRLAPGRRKGSIPYNPHILKGMKFIDMLEEKQQSYKRNAEG